MVNRTSEPLDLGARKFWDTPGKLCFFTSPSHWGQFWVVYPRLWYESTLSNTPKTLRKVIPVKGWSKWANWVLDQAGQTLRWKVPLTKKKRLHGPSCSRAWKFRFTSDLFHLDLTPSCNILFRDMLDGSLENYISKLQMWALMRDALQWIFQLHEAFSTALVPPYCKWKHELLWGQVWLVWVINLVSSL